MVVAVDEAEAGALIFQEEEEDQETEAPGQHRRDSIAVSGRSVAGETVARRGLAESMMKGSCGLSR